MNAIYYVLKHDDMKTMSLLFTLLLTAGMLSVQAQSCADRHAEAKSASVKSCHGSATAAAAKFAAQDENIIEKVCPVTGKVAYMEKITCTHSGKVTYADVEFDAEQAKFVRLASLEEGGQVPAHAKAAGCASKKAACCSNNKACCAHKSADARSAATSEKATVKLVKSQKGT